LPRQENFFSNIVFDFVGLFLVDIFVRNLRLPPQTKNPMYGPELLRRKVPYVKIFVRHVLARYMLGYHFNFVAINLE